MSETMFLYGIGCQLSCCFCCKW